MIRTLADLIRRLPASRFWHYKARSYSVLNPAKPKISLLRTLIALLPLLSAWPVRILSQEIPFHSYSVKDGLISNSINSICQDSRGYIWIGTSDGISVFDGRLFTNYTTNDGLANNYVSDILEDNRYPGIMWIATIGGGISKYVCGKFTGVYPLRETVFLSNKVDIPKEGMSDAQGAEAFFTRV